MATVKKKKKSNFVDQVVNGEYQSIFSKNNAGTGSNTVSLLGDDSPFLSTQKKSSFADQVVNGTYESIINNVPKSSKGEKETTTLSSSVGNINKEGYKSTGKKYGDYKYQGYKERKDYEIYEKEGKYYYYDVKRKSYIPMDQAELTTPELDKKSYEEAKKQGYTGSKDTLKIADRIKLDTANLTEEEYKDYKKDLERQQEDKEETEKRKNRVRVGGAGLKGSLGELETLFSNAGANIDDNIIEPVRDVKDNYKVGKMTEQLGLEAYKKMTGEKNDYDKIRKEYDKYVTFNEDIINNANYLDQAIQTIPNQVGGLIAGAKGGGVGGIAGAILGGGVGAVATRTPQGALAGAEKGAKFLGQAGYVGGQSQYTYKIEAGLQYQTLIDMGVPEDIAKKEAKDTGLFNALVEGGESILDLVSFGGLSKVKGALTKKLVEKYGEETVTSWARKTALQNLVTEGLEEGIQEGGSIHNEKQALEQTGIERDDSKDWERIKESIIAGGLAGFLLGGGVSAVTGTAKVGVKAINEKAIKSNVEQQINAYEKETGIKLTTDEKKELLNETLTRAKEIQNTQKESVSQQEKELQKQQFVYEAKDTDSEARIKLAQTTDVLNNSKAHHELFELTSKIAEDTGISIKFVNDSKQEMVEEKQRFTQKYAKSNGITLEEANSKLKDLTIDGFVNDKGELIVNADSPKALNVILGHETTHLFENTKEYAPLQKALFELAETRGDMKKLREDMTRLYEGTNANIDNEITSELAGEYLFTDQDFINRLSAEQPSTFKKIYDYLKHLYKTVTAQNKEARQLEQVMYRYEKAYKEFSKTNTQQSKTNLTTEVDNNRAKELSGTKYSLSDNQGRTLSKEQQEYFKDSKIRDEEGNLLTVYHGTDNDFNVFKRKPGKRNIGGLVEYEATAKGFFFSTKKDFASEYGSKTKEFYLNITNPLFSPNKTYTDSEISDIQYILQPLVDEDVKSGDLTIVKYDDGSIMYKSDSLYRNPENIWKSYASKETGIDWEYTDSETFDEVIKRMKEKGYDGTFIDELRQDSEGNNISSIFAIESNQIKNVDNTNPTSDADIRYSLSKVDNKGRELTPQQQEYFKDSKARDEKGNLLTLYHGTYNDEMFTVFDAKKGFNVDAIYLTPDLSVSSHFGNGSTIRNFDKTLIPRINEVKTVDDLIKIFNDDLNNKIEITKSYSDENGDFYRLETMDGVSSEALGYKTGKNTYSFTNLNGKVKETNLFDKLKKEALEEAQQNQSYASNYEVYTNIVNPLVVDAKGKPYYKINFEGKITNTETISAIAKERGYDGVIVKNVLETSYENQLTDDYIVFNSNQIKDVKNTTPTENKDIRYSLSEKGLKKIADEFGGGKNYWEANLYDKDLNSSIRFLKSQSSVKNKFKKLNDINVEPVYKDVKLRGIGSEDSKVQNFIKENNLNVIDLVNNQKLLDEFYKLEHEAIKKQFSVDDVEANEIFSQWKDYFERQKNVDTVIWPLLRFEKDFKNIIEGNTKEIDSIETSKLERQLVEDNPEFEEFVRKYAEPLFADKPQYTTDEVMEEAIYNHGTTKDFETGAYMTTDGQLLDFNYGGYRDDHRTISAFGLDMTEFMNYGAIRMQPETPGFEMNIEPTAEQYSKLYDYIDYLKETKDSDIMVDIDTGKGYDSAEYNINTPTNKIISDLKEYWRTGKFPKQSEYAKFRYSLSNQREEIAPIGKGKRIYGNKALGVDIAPLEQKIDELSQKISDLQENIAPVSQDIVERENMNNFNTLTDEDAPTNLSDEETRELNRLNSLPFDLEGEEQSRVDELTRKQDEYGSFTFDNETPEVKNKSTIIKDLKGFGMSQQEARNLYNKIANDITTTPEDIFEELKNYRDIYEESDYYKQIRNDIKGTRLNISNIKDQIKDYGNSYRMSLMGKRLILGNSGQPIDTFYQELSNNYPDVFSPEITAEADQLDAIVDFLYRDDKMLVDRLSDGEITELANKIYNEIDTTERLNNTRETLYSNSNFKNLVSLLEAGEIAPETYEDFLKSLPKELSTKYEPYLDFARELNASSTDKTRQKDRIRSLLDEKSIKVQETTNEPTISSNNPFNELLDKFLKRKRTKPDVAPKVEKSKVRNLVDTTKELFVNRNTEIDNLAKESGNLNIKYAGDMLNSVAGEVEGDIYTAQTDNYGHEIGKSVSGLFQEAKNKGLYDAFNDYLEQYSNIDRHSRGKGSQTPLAVSQTLVQEYEKSYPEFKKMAQDVWKYSSNIRDNMVESGLIMQEFSDTLAEMYPHYVPFMENREMTNVYQDIGEAKPKGVIKYAKGGAKNLLPVEEALTKYTYASKKAIRQNQLYQQIVNTLNDKVEIGADVRSDPTELNESLYRDEKGNYLTAYVNGKQESVRISDNLYRGLKNDMESRLKDLEQRLSLITKPLQKVSEVRRNLLTTWSPTFIITNPVKDIQDAVFNSKYTKDMLKNYPTSFVELSRAKSETAKQFLTLYGSGNTQGDYSVDSGLNKGIAKKNTKFLKGISKLNNIVELAPRYAEFKASLENGATVPEAMYNAREITTNFNRGGTITKALNRNGATFLNTSVQGFDKFVRNFSGENGAKGVASALLKAGLFGVLPGVFNELVFGGDDDDKDEDYEALPDYIKDNYYLIKTGDGEFIRIPKGRMLSVFGSASRRTIEYLNGEDDAFEGFLKNAYTQVGFDDPAESNIFTPIKQAIDNKAWYGGDLVPSRLQKLAPKEQYDASTDKFSIWLGDKLNISPYKINYVLDQYTGGIGDMLLPLITEEAQSDSDSIPEMMLAPIRDKFTANSTSDNKYASDIYTLSDEMDKATSDIKETDEYKIQDSYLYDITSQMAKLYQERRDVQADTSLSKSEKYKKAQSIQEQINSLAKEGLDNYKNVQKTDNYAIVGGREFNKYTTDDGKERWGKPREDELNDLNSMGMTLYEKSSYFKAKTDISSIKDEYKDSEDYVGQKRDIIDVIKNTYLNDEQKSYLYDRYYGNTETLGIINAIGIDFDSYLDYEYQSFRADKDENGKSISGSKKQKVFDYINSMDIDFEQKLILAKLQYNNYNEYNYDIVDYLNNNDDISYEDEVYILKKLGFAVDDEGNIYW